MWVWIAHFDKITGHTLTEEEAQELTEYADLRQARDIGGLMYNEQVHCNTFCLTRKIKLIQSLYTQSGHSRSVGNRFYGYSTSDFRHLGRETLHNFWLCSKEWGLLLSTYISYVY